MEVDTLGQKHSIFVLSLIKYCSTCLKIPVLDPIDIDTLFEEGTYTYVHDPYEATGFPFRATEDAENGLCVLSIKEVLQNIALGNVANLGFKLIANEKNDPFESIRFEKNQDIRLQILYVTN